MIIEISKAGFQNKGAHLMLYAIIKEIKHRYPEAKITISPKHLVTKKPLQKITKLGLYPKIYWWKFRIQWGKFDFLIPKFILKKYRLIKDKEVDFVLDAAGFAYSDQSSILNSLELSQSMINWKKRKTKVFLLPQAFGPFKNRKNVVWTKKWLKDIELVFARDPESYNHLAKLNVNQEKIKLFPDFTNLIDGKLPKNFSTNEYKIALVPNYRMIDKLDIGSEYVDLMSKCILYIKNLNLKPFILLHEDKRAEMLLAKQILSRSYEIPIINETDPIKLKGIIGNCDAIIGSRYHALVSALSQGIPAIGTGWSHKYKHLFEEYDYPEGMISTKISVNDLNEKLDKFFDKKNLTNMKEKLKKKSLHNKELTKKMWEIIFSKIDESLKN